MDAKLRYVEIKKLFDQYDVEWNIEKDTTVLVGQNGSGKTTILKIIMTILSSEYYATDELIDSFLSCSLVDNLNKKYSFGGDSFSRYLYEMSKKREEAKLSIKDKKILEKILGEFSTGTEINLFIEFISTLNMSANAINKVISSDGKSLNILDIEINQAITDFQKLRDEKNYSEIKEKVIRVLNDFFNATQKTIQLSNVDFTIESAKKEKLKISQLSAGERQIIYIVFKVATAYFNEALILMDEPEISLHLEWQEKLLKNLREINDKSQMIVVTHSPAIIMDGWMDSYVDIQTILKPIKDDE